MGIW
ncbi:MAG: hypothetical protein EZS28_028763, partial [Streblomastix strix]